MSCTAHALCAILFNDSNTTWTAYHIQCDYRTGWRKIYLKTMHNRSTYMFISNTKWHRKFAAQHKKTHKHSHAARSISTHLSYTKTPIHCVINVFDFPFTLNTFHSSLPPVLMLGAIVILSWLPFTVHWKVSMLLFFHRQRKIMYFIWISSCMHY